MAHSLPKEDPCSAKKDYRPCGILLDGNNGAKSYRSQPCRFNSSAGMHGEYSFSCYGTRSSEPRQQHNAVIRGACSDRNQGQLLARTELYFGRAKPDGSMVSDDEFRAFLDNIITPRFPNGLTVLSGAGQFRGSSGVITREGSMFVILLYAAGEKDSSARIEEIRASYRKTFAQESVLRVDGESCVHF